MRNRVVATLLRSLLAQERRQSRPALLDVGCGSFGVAMFLREIPVIGVDREQPRTTIPNLTFRRAAITALPFPTGPSRSSVVSMSWNIFRLLIVNVLSENYYVYLIATS